MPVQLVTLDNRKRGYNYNAAIQDTFEYIVKF